MLHSLESIDFLKVDPENYILFECADEEKVISVEQEFHKGIADTGGDEEDQSALETKYDNIYFTPGTGKYYGASNDNILTYDEVIDMLKDKKVGLFIIVSKRDGLTNTRTNGWKLRRTAINTNTPVMTNIKCVKL